MSQINVTNLTFSYDTNYENIFENVCVSIDTDWKLGFIGRNGRGKTTFLKLLMGQYEYSGNITSSVSFDYFPFMLRDTNEASIKVVKNLIAPFELWEKQMEDYLEKGTQEALDAYGDILDEYIEHDGYNIEELIKIEAAKLEIKEEVLQRPFCTLSNGERTKLMLAALFLRKNNFLLIDEPTNHLDMDGRRVVGDYLASKKGFILVSHDRNFLDRVIDHVLSINKNNIEIQQGNYTSWKFNKDRQDNFEIEKNARLKKDITRLKNAFEQKANWSDKIEDTKIGTHAGDRGAIGHRAAKMMKRAKSIESRQQSAIDEKSKLLKNIDKADPLKLHPVQYFKSRIIDIKNLSIDYENGPLFEDVSFSLDNGERLALIGGNGSGKSSILKLLIGENIPHSGSVNVGNNLAISYVSQDTSYLKGNLKEFAENEKIDESLFKAILRKLDFTRLQFEKDMADFSGGQKKKVLIAKSLCQSANLYIWDEPLNFIDIFSRVQIEELIMEYCPTMIFVEHDSVFCERIATKSIILKNRRN